MISRRHVTIAMAGTEPPTEFRIFTAGEVETSKGTFTFDETSALSVMAEYEAHGIDLMIDYDHASVSGSSPDPAQSGKAAGWFNLEVRNGELWAVNVRWTPPAAEALRQKEWRFMSPAFSTDESGRITSVLNVAITNLPATRKLEPLVAASVNTLTTLGGSMDPALVKKALDALVAGSAEEAMSILKDMIASAAGAAPAAEEEPAAELAEDPAAAEEEKEEQAAVIAATSHLSRVTGKTLMSDIVGVVDIWRASHVALEAETAKLAKERAALEAGKRKENAVTLTKLGAETPHTTGLATGKLCKRLLEEPLKEQTDRVEALLAARGGKLPTAPIPPTGGGVGADGTTQVTLADGRVVPLKPRELAMCTEMKIDPKDYAARKPVKKD